MTGLGCYHWTQQAAETSGIDVLSLTRYMAVSITKATNDGVINLYKLDADPHTKQYSWHWARMFSDGAFKVLSIRKDLLYASVMVAIVTDIRGDHPLWNIASLNVEGMDSVKSRAMTLAQRIKNDLKQKKSNDINI